MISFIHSFYSLDNGWVDRSAIDPAIAPLIRFVITS